MGRRQKMGNLARAGERMPRKKKKKGRPSLLDLQKRSLKQQQQQLLQNPNVRNPNLFNADPCLNLRSARRNPNVDASSSAKRRLNSGADDDEDEDDERKEKKQRLLLGLNSHRCTESLSPDSALFSSHRNPNDEDPKAAIGKRKIGDACLGFDQPGQKVLKATDTTNGPQLEFGPTKPLPDKKLLVFILDRLQKKDTYGVFSEPVDPEELPDYHDIIEHPMDFATVRNKLEGGLYANLEEFEKDVFLICTNAMQYNSSDTIYFRQARSIQELAKKDFDNLRQDSDDGETQPKVARRGRPPKSLKKSCGRTFLEHVGPEISSEVTLSAGRDNDNGSNGYNLRKGSASYKFRSSGSYNSEAPTSWLSEWESEFPASVVKAVLKYGRNKVVLDVNKRETYKHLEASGPNLSFSTIFEEELKQLVAIDLNADHGYARSLAQFAANLGPLVWKIAAKKIGRVLPTGIKFGPGWVGENELSERQPFLFSSNFFMTSNSIPDRSPNKPGSPDTLDTNLIYRTSTSGPNCMFGGSNSLRHRDDIVSVGELNFRSDATSLKTGNSGFAPCLSRQFHVDCTHGSNSSGPKDAVGDNILPHTAAVGMPLRVSCSDEPPLPSQISGMVTTREISSCSLPEQSIGIATATTSEIGSCSMSPKDLDSEESMWSEILSRSQAGNHLALGSKLGLDMRAGGDFSCPGLWVHRKQDFLYSSVVNMGFLAPIPNSSSVQIGSPQQPDLALQL